MRRNDPNSPNHSGLVVRWAQEPRRRRGVGKAPSRRRRLLDGRPQRQFLLSPEGYAANPVTCLANSGLSLTTPSSRIVKSAGCNASDFRNVRTARPLRLHHVEDKGRRAVPVIVHYPEHRVRAKTLGPRVRGDDTEDLGWPSIALGANQSCAIKRRGFVIRLVGYDLRDREGWWRARPNSPPNRR